MIMVTESGTARCQYDVNFNWCGMEHQEQSSVGLVTEEFNQLPGAKPWGFRLPEKVAFVVMKACNEMIPLE